MSNCQNTRELISQKLDGELNDIEQNQLNEHLASCSNCQKYYNSMIDIHNKLLSMPDISLGESIVDRLIDNNVFEVNEDLNPYKKRKWKTWASAVAAAVLIGISLPYSLIYNQINDEKINMAEQPAEIALLEENIDMNLSKIKLSENVNMGSAVEKGLEENSATDSEVGIVVEENPELTNFGENDQFEVTFSETMKELMPFKIEEKENRLVIYKDNVELFRSNRWENGLLVKWESINKNEIIYSLYSSDDNIVAKYRINIKEKNEEKIK